MGKVVMYRTLPGGRERPARTAVRLAAGDVGGQVLAAGLIDEVRMDVAPVVGVLRGAPIGAFDVDRSECPPAELLRPVGDLGSPRSGG